MPASAKRDFQTSRPYELREVDEPQEFDVLLSERPAGLSKRLVARPAHDGREDVARLDVAAPLRQEDRMLRRPPIDAVRKRRLRDSLADAEEDVVCGDACLEALLAARHRELHLREPGVRSDVRERGNVPVLPRPHEGAGDVDEQVGGRKHLAALAVREAVPARLDGEAVEPAIAEAEPLHHGGEVPDVRRRIVRDPALLRVAAVQRVRPLPRILEVVDVVAEACEPRRELDVVPRDTAETRVLRDQARDDDAEARHGARPSRDAATASPWRATKAPFSARNCASSSWNELPSDAMRSSRRRLAKSKSSRSCALRSAISSRAAGESSS